MCDMTKHILPLTYEPKIPGVISGKITQTIRPFNSTKQKKVGDLIMFHGWTGKPRRSKWSFRTPYWKIIETFDIIFYKNYVDDRIILRKPDEDDCFHDLSVEEINNIAVLDGFEDIKEMFKVFLGFYGDGVYDSAFTVIRWKYNGV